MKLLGRKLERWNRSFWTYVSVKIQKVGNWKNYFSNNGHEILIMPHTSHIIKRLKLAVITGVLHIPDDVKEAYNLSSNRIAGEYIQKLWDDEVNKRKELRLLYHLTEDDLNPGHQLKMNVGSATHYFSGQTVGALQLVIERGQLPEEAKTTMWFISKVEQWFAVVSSRLRRTSITKRNRLKKFCILEEMLHIFENIEIKGKRWKPLNMGMILYCLSLMDSINFLF